MKKRMFLLLVAIFMGTIGISKISAYNFKSIQVLANSEYSTGILEYIKCGDTYDIPAAVPKIVSLAINLLKIATPIILVIVSMITLVKAVSASKGDEIKKAQYALIKKIIAGALVFFIVSIIQLVMSIAADSAEIDSLTNCFDCFLSNSCASSKYEKENISGVDFCKIKDSNGNINTYECKKFYAGDFSIPTN